jgi:hypothetical protein
MRKKIGNLGDRRIGISIKVYHSKYDICAEKLTVFVKL